jgi:hypothetical protein
MSKCEVLQFSVALDMKDHGIASLEAADDRAQLLNRLERRAT